MMNDWGKIFHTVLGEGMKNFQFFLSWATDPISCSPCLGGWELWELESNILRNNKFPTSVFWTRERAVWWSGKIQHHRRRSKDTEMLMSRELKGKTTWRKKLQRKNTEWEPEFPAQYLVQTPQSLSLLLHQKVHFYTHKKACSKCHCI